MGKAILVRNGVVRELSESEYRVEREHSGIEMKCKDIKGLTNKTLRFLTYMANGNSFILKEANTKPDEELLYLGDEGLRLKVCMEK